VYDATAAQTALELNGEFRIDHVRRKSTSGALIGSRNQKPVADVVVVGEQRAASDRDAGGTVERPDTVATASIEEDSGRGETQPDALVARSTAVVVRPHEHPFYRRRRVVGRRLTVNDDEFQTVPRHALQSYAGVGAVYLHARF